MIDMEFHINTTTKIFQCPRPKVPTRESQKTIDPTNLTLKAQAPLTHPQLHLEGGKG